MANRKGLPSGHIVKLAAMGDRAVHGRAPVVACTSRFFCAPRSRCASFPRWHSSSRSRCAARWRALLWTTRRAASASSGRTTSCWLVGTLGPIARPVTPPLSLADIRRAQTVLLWRTAHWAVLVVRNCARRTPVKLKGSRRRTQTPQASRISTPSSPASPRRSMRVGYAWGSA
jgi:hypothetical protein